MLKLGHQRIAVKPISRLMVACATSLVMVLAWGCSGPTSGTVSKSVSPSATEPVSHDSMWLPVDLPGQFSEMRSAVFDQARNCLWVITREFGAYGGNPMLVTLTRVNVADRSTITMPFKLPGDGYDVGLMAVDAHDILWMGWGKTLTRFDPDTGATKQWKLPAYSGLAQLYSMDGRIEAMTIDSHGEIWVAAGMVSAVFGFKPKTGTWDRPISLPFVPVVWRTMLAAPGPGILTITGAALDRHASPRFAVITTATRSVKTLPIQVERYVSIGGGQIVYWDGVGKLSRLRLRDALSTQIGTTPIAWGADANMALDVQGNIWLPISAKGFTGIAKVNPSTGAVAQFLFPIVIAYFMPTPSPNPCTFHCLPAPCYPAIVYRCIPRPESIDPEIQGMAPDASGNLWMVTWEPSLTNLEDSHPMGPIVELQPTA